MLHDSWYDMVGITVLYPYNRLEDGGGVTGVSVLHHLLFAQGLTWTRIANTVLAGARSIPLSEQVRWKAGDKFVLTTTSWKDEIINQNEVLTVASLADNNFTVNTVEALQFNHYGESI